MAAPRGPLPSGGAVEREMLVWLDLAEPPATPLESLLPDPYRWLLLALESRSL
jgi:hypothetical protein